MMEKRFLIHGTNAIGDDSYFITTTDMEDHFLHDDGKTKDGDQKYKLAKGNIGGAIFTLKNANAFISHFGFTNLKPVKITDVLGKDGSQN